MRVAGGSLRRRLTVWIVVATTVAWGTGAAWLLHEVREETGRTLDAQLEEAAHLVLAYASEQQRRDAVRQRQAAERAAERRREQARRDAERRREQRQRAAELRREEDERRHERASRERAGSALEDAGRGERATGSDRTRRAGHDDDHADEHHEDRGDEPHHDDDHGFELPSLRQELPAQHVAYQLRDPSGRIVLRSAGAPPQPLGQVGETGLADHQVAGLDWRVYTLADPQSGLEVHVAEQASRRARFARAAGLVLIAPGLGLLVVLLAAAGWATRSVLRPVEAAARRLDSVSPGDDSPIDPGALPSELAPLVHAIARLQARVRDALLRERTLTADAAHELRAPLAALRAQAQWARRAEDAGERSTALEGVIQAADRCARLADAVLTLARLDAGATEGAAAPPVAAAEIVRIALHDVEHAAARRGLRLESSIAAVRLAVDPDALAVAVRNLLDNAVRHAATRVELALRQDATGATLAVRDDGPGIAPEHRDRLFDRFWRGDRSGGGSGLGLAIVQRVAELHGAAIETGPGLEGKGFGVTIRWPLADPAHRSTGPQPSP